MRTLNFVSGPWRRLLGLVAVYCTLGTLYLRPVRAEDMPSILETVRRKFPGVRQLSTQDLADWLAKTNRPAPLLIDIRARAEFEVSHLQGARHAESVAAVRKLVPSLGAPVVVYCSVGYRSSAFAEKLQRAGLTNVWNLEGSIFAWANEGRPVYRDQKLIREVHPFDAKWGQLLNQQFHPAASAGSGRKTNPVPPNPSPTSP